MQLNFGGHTSSEPDFLPVPPARQAALTWALARTRWIAKNTPRANAYFRKLPLGRSFGDLIDDRSIWINYSTSQDYYGVINMAGGSEIAIAELSFGYNRWIVLATLVHELAHAGGAPVSGTFDAENAVLACGLGRRVELKTGVDDRRTPYDPTVIGALSSRGGTRFA